MAAAARRAIPRSTQARGRFIAPCWIPTTSSCRIIWRACTRCWTAPRNFVGYARVRVDRGDGRVFLKPPRALRPARGHGDLSALRPRLRADHHPGGAARYRAARSAIDENLRAAEDTDFAIRLALAGYRFRMLEEPGAIWNDINSIPSASPRPRARSTSHLWLEILKPLIASKAYHGGRGWAYAKLIAPRTPVDRAGACISTRCCAAATGPSLAADHFPADFPGPAAYRRLADIAIVWLRAGLREPEKKPAPLPKLERA